MQTIVIINSYKVFYRIIFQINFMRFFIISFFVFLSFNVLSQADKYVNLINPQTARKHLEYLASDELEGREAGKKGQKLAGAYLMQNFLSYGLPPIKGEYFQRFNLRVSSPKNISLTVNGDTLTYFNDFLHNSDFPDSNFQNSQSVFVGYGIESEKYNELENVDVANKVVFMLEGSPRFKKIKYTHTDSETIAIWSDRDRKIKNLVDKKAKAIIMVKSKIDLFKKSYAHAFTSSRMMLATDTFLTKIPLLFISEEKADSLFKAGGLVTGFKRTKSKIAKKGIPLSTDLSLKISVQSNIVNDKISSENVLGYIEGSDKKDEVIIVTAHYDHIGKHDGKIFNGADDDASGTAALLMMAKAFSKAKEEGNGPRRSILFMPVSAEEKGLLGSRYYSENPIFPLENTVTNLNIDMIGRVDEAHHDNKGIPNPDYVYIIGSDFLSEQLHQINEKQNQLYTKLELDYTFNSLNHPNRFFQRSDHYNFAKHGIPVIFYFNGTHQDYHKHTDTIEKIDFMKLSKITKLVYYTAWELANRESRIALD